MYHRHRHQCSYGANFFVARFVGGDVVFAVVVGAPDAAFAFAAGVAFAVAAETYVVAFGAVAVAFGVEALNNVVAEWRSVAVAMAANSSCYHCRTDRSWYYYAYLSLRFSSCSFSRCCCCCSQRCCIAFEVVAAAFASVAFVADTVEAGSYNCLRLRCCFYYFYYYSRSNYRSLAYLRNLCTSCHTYQLR